MCLCPLQTYSDLGGLCSEVSRLGYDHAYVVLVSSLVLVLAQCCARCMLQCIGFVRNFGVLK